VQHQKTYANLDAGEDCLTIGLNRAVTLIAEKIANPAKAGASAPTRARAGRSSAARRADPGQEGPLRPLRDQQRHQRHDPGQSESREITLDEAVELIEARAEKTGAKPAPRRKGPRKAMRRASPKRPAPDKKPQSCQSAKKKSCREGAQAAVAAE
jgi:DNA topoisomerase-1